MWTVKTQHVVFVPKADSHEEHSFYFVKLCCEVVYFVGNGLNTSRYRQRTLRILAPCRRAAGPSVTT